MLGFRCVRGLFWVVLLFAVVSSSCVSSNHSLVEENYSVQETAGQWLPSPSQIRQTSWETSDLVQYGSAFIAPSYQVTVDGIRAVFSPNPDGEGMEQWAWATYAFELADYTGALTINLKWMEETAADLWIGVSNWEDDTWEFSTKDVTAPTFAIADTNDAIHPEDHMCFIAIVFKDTDIAALEEVQVGGPADPGWSHTWGSSEDDFINDICVFDENNFVFCGETWGFDVDDKCGFVGKVTMEGNLEWFVTIQHNDRAALNDVEVHDGNILSVGLIRDFNSFDYNGLVVELSPEGVLEEKWEFSTTGSKSDVFESIAVGPNGEILIGGNTYCVPNPETRDDCDTLAVKLNPDLSFDEATTFGDETYERNATALAIVEAGELSEFVIVFNSYDSPDFFTAAQPRIAVCDVASVWDFREIVTTDYDIAEFRDACCGETGIGLAGYCIPNEAGSQAQLLWAELNDLDQASWSASAESWSTPGVTFSEAFAIDYFMNQYFVVGTTGELVPEFKMFPIIVACPDGSIDPHGFRWGDGYTGQEVRAVGHTDNEYMILGGSAINASGSWEGCAGDTSVKLVEITKENLSTAELDGTTVYSTDPDVTVQEEDLDPSYDDGEGWVDLMFWHLRCFKGSRIQLASATQCLMPHNT